jgi:hypothetical protein
MVNVLIEKGAGVNKGNKDRYTPLHIACIRDNRDILHVLLKAGVDINAKTIDGITPLHIACAKYHYATTKELLRAQNIDINSLNDDYETSLMTSLKKYKDRYINSGVYIRHIIRSLAQHCLTHGHINIGKSLYVCLESLKISHQDRDDKNVTHNFCDVICVLKR